MLIDLLKVTAKESEFYLKLVLDSAPLLFKIHTHLIRKF